MRSYLAVTRDATLTSLKALFDATKDNTDGIGSTDDGALTVIDDRPGATSTIVGPADALWPSGMSAPYAWAVTPETLDDTDLWRMNGDAVSVLDDPLLIDDVLYLAGGVQLTGDRPTGSLTVRAHQARRIVDASARTVTVPSPAEARVKRARAVPAPSYGNPTARNLAHNLIVWTGTAWRRLTLRALLSGAIDEPDTGRRYAFSLAGTSGTLPTITVAQIEATMANSVVGLATGVLIPAITVPQGQGAFTVIAIPADDPFRYFARGGSNAGFNGRDGFTDDPQDTLTLTGGDMVDVYVRETNPLLATSDTFAYFGRDATNP